VLLRTNVDKLTLLPSGTPHPKATELLAVRRHGRLLDDMATRYSDRIVIFDSPPLLLTTESRVLASHMGQIVVVVHAGRTLQAEVQHALSTIEACPIRLMLLNKARRSARTPTATATAMATVMATATAGDAGAVDAGHLPAQGLNEAGSLRSGAVCRWGDQTGQGWLCFGRRPAACAAAWGQASRSCPA
jgi:hypothetical protein